MLFTTIKNSQLILVKNKNKMVEMSYERNKIAEINPEAILWDGLDNAIIGFTADGKAVYDIEMMVSIVWKNNQKHITSDEAREWVDFNILSTYVGEHTPINIWMFNEDEEE